MRLIVHLIAVFSVFVSGIEASSCCLKSSKPPASSCSDPNQVSEISRLDKILLKMNQATTELDSCVGNVHYLFIQDPELLDARTIRTGHLYYQKFDTRSKLRMDFLTVQQDDEEPQKRPEYYLFDGVWLTKVDTSLETIDIYQKTPENRPVEAFKFVSHNFPMVGFSESQDLKKEFHIQLKDGDVADPNRPIILSLQVREDSIYKEDYSELEVWVDTTAYYPYRLKAVSTQGDLYDLRLEKLEINKKLKNEVFTIETPAHFRKNTHPLEE